MAYGKEYEAKSNHQMIRDGVEQPIYKIGKYNVQINYSKRIVYVSEPDRPERIDQSISLMDGVLNVDFSFIVEEVLRKCDPIEIARGMCEDADVREHFIESLAERWSQDNVGDAERRKFLTKVGCAVNEITVDRLADTMRKWEYEFCRRAYVDEHVSNINRTLRELNVMVQGPSTYSSSVPGEWERGPDVLLQMRRLDERTTDADGKSIPGPVAITGQAWEQARTYWRDEIGRLFPPPLAPMPVAFDAFAIIQGDIDTLRNERSGSTGSEFVTVSQKALDAVLSKIDDMRGMKPPKPPVSFGEFAGGADAILDSAETPAASIDSGDDIPF
jgi:hypothetical protein